MFNIFKKDPNKNFNFHIDRTKKLLTKAQERFDRADGYLCGEGFGNDPMKQASAQGALGKAHNILKEAIFNASEAIKYSNGNQEKNTQLKIVVNNFSSIKVEKTFVHPSINEAWDRAMRQWMDEFNQIFKGE